MFKLSNAKKILTFIIVAAVILSVSGCGKPDDVPTGAASTNVTVSEVKTQTIEETATYTGELKAAESTSVSVKVSGVVESVYCEIGDYVSAGDILMQIDKTDYLTQYNQANTAYLSVLSQSKALIDSAQIEYNNAKINCDNQKVLYDNGAISKIAYDSAVTRFENAKINLNSAKEQSGLNSAKAALDAAENSLGYTTVYAPISGYVSTKNANVGQMASPGVEIFSIKNTATVNAQLNVAESVISKVSVGAKAIVNVKSIETSVEGVVKIASPTKNLQTGMYNVSITIDNPEDVLKDGMFADITLTLSDAVDALVIPSDAIMEDESGQKYIFLADDGVAVKKEVVTGIITEEYTEILKGVKEGDKVIVSGKEYLSDENSKIKIVK